MKFLIISCLLAAAAADVSHIVTKDGQSQIVKQEVDVGPDGTYSWSFQSDNGIAAEEQGALKKQAEGDAIAAQGRFSFTSPEGEKVDIAYTADENGFQPQGSHIPTSPPIPDAIIRALKYIEANPPKPEKY